MEITVAFAKAMAGVTQNANSTTMQPFIRVFSEIGKQLTLVPAAPTALGAHSALASEAKASEEESSNKSWMRARSGLELTPTPSASTDDQILPVLALVTTEKQLTIPLAGKSSPQGKERRGTGEMVNTNSPLGDFRPAGNDGYLDDQLGAAKMAPMAITGALFSETHNSSQHVSSSWALKPLSQSDTATSSIGVRYVVDEKSIEHLGGNWNEDVDVFVL